MTHAAVIAGAMPGQEPERARILLVDDQPDNLLSAGAVLESLGEEVVCADSGREALRHLLHSDFAVIVLDVMMPDMDGFETAELIRSRERSRDVPIIFVTALGKSEEYLFRGYDLGAVDYLFKPIVPQVLRSKVSVFVELAKKKRLLERHAELLTARNAELERAMAQKQQAEREILLLNAHLERRMAEVSAINRELEAFSYSVSHDLRGPLNRIAGFSRALAESYGGAFDETGKRYLERIENSSQRMCRLVDELLNLARLSRAELRRESVDLSAVVRSIAADLVAGEPARSVEFLIAEGIQADGDAALLRVALLNLVENAWKFTRLVSGACVEFGSMPQGGVTAYFLRDNGAGFDMSRSERLFKPFQRLHAHSEFEGTGIGLATVERIVGRHGGKIWAVGSPGAGACFYFTLQPEPAGGVGMRGSMGQQGTALKKEPLRVLVVEDSEEDADLVMLELRRGGFEPVVRRVDDAASLRAALEEGPWDIVLSDYSMPSMTMPEALAIVQQKGLDVPFVIVSATIGEDAAVSAMKAGAHDYILKHNLGRLVPAVQRELRESNVRRERRELEERLRQGAETRKPGTPGRRHRARFQQPAHRHPG